MEFNPDRFIQENHHAYQEIVMIFTLSTNCENSGIDDSSNVSKEYSIFSRTPQLYWIRICYARDEDYAAPNLLKAQNRKWNYWERCRCWSTIYETVFTLESEAELTESAFHLSVIDCSKMTVQSSWKKPMEINVVEIMRPLQYAFRFLAVRSEPVTGSQNWKFQFEMDSLKFCLPIQNLLWLWYIYHQKEKKFIDP